MYLSVISNVLKTAKSRRLKTFLFVGDVPADSSCGSERVTKDKGVVKIVFPWSN